MTVKKSISLLVLTSWMMMAAVAYSQEPSKTSGPGFQLPSVWKMSTPLIQPEDRAENRSRAQKDPTVVYAGNRWHVFMTVKLLGRSAIEYCSFTDWSMAQQAPRILLKISGSDYFCAPQVFYFRPHNKWYLIYQMGVEGSKKMWVAYSTTDDISDPESWTKAMPILDGGEEDPRTVGGLDYWIICDEERAYLFLTSLNGKMWRLWTDLKSFPAGFGDCEVALTADIFEASHTYRIQGQDRYLTLIEANGQRYFQAYVADRLDGPWRPLATTFERPFASAKNVESVDGVELWADNISHGELIRATNDETLTIAPSDWRFVFQGMLQKHKQGQAYGALQWRIGMLTGKAGK